VNREAIHGCLSGGTRRVDGVVDSTGNVLWRASEAGDCLPIRGRIFGVLLAVLFISPFLPVIYMNIRT
jgi:hypothetical protein